MHKRTLKALQETAKMWGAAEQLTMLGWPTGRHERFLQDLVGVPWRKWLSTDTFDQFVTAAKDGATANTLIPALHRHMLRSLQEETQRSLTDAERVKLETTLESLGYTPRELKTLQLYYGFSGQKQHTLKEMTTKLGLRVTATVRVRQILDKALRKTRHPARFKHLMKFLTWKHARYALTQLDWPGTG